RERLNVATSIVGLGSTLVRRALAGPARDDAEAVGAALTMETVKPLLLEVQRLSSDSLDEALAASSRDFAMRAEAASSMSMPPLTPELERYLLLPDDAPRLPQREDSVAAFLAS